MKKYFMLIALCMAGSMQGMKLFKSKLFFGLQLQKRFLKTTPIKLEENDSVTTHRTMYKVTRDLPLQERQVKILSLLKERYSNETIIKHAFDEIMSGSIKSGHN